MKIAFISPIHPHLGAFSQVLKDIDRVRVDSVICLGDSVGYGPDAEAVVRILRERRIPQIMGNRELGLVDPGTLSWFKPPSRASLRITRRLF